MGINGLWKAVEVSGVDISLDEFFILCDMKQNRHRDNKVVIGVDTTMLMAQCNAVKRTAHGASPLKILFFKLCKFLKLFGNVVFVFDGKERPKLKHGRFVPCNEEPSWYGPCQNMIKAFGFYIHMAPGEGEAELAELNKRGLIDYVMSGDSDIFVFGAVNVIRHIPAQKKSTTREAVKAKQVLYENDKIATSPDVSLSQGGLFLFGLFSGGDYSTGVSGFGAKIVHALAKSGLGDSLYDGCTRFDGLARRAFLNSWLDAMRDELRTNSHGHLPSRQPSLAQNICEGLIPRNEVIDLYIRPTTSFSEGHQPPEQRAWRKAISPDIPVATIAAEHLSWNTTAEIIKHFHGNVWEGVFLRMIYSPFRIFNRVSMVVTMGPQAAEMVELQAARRQTKHASTSLWYRVTLSTSDFCHSVATALGETTFTIPPGQSTELKLWAPKRYFPAVIIPFKRGLKPLRSDPYCVESIIGVFTPDRSESPPAQPAAESSAMGAQHGLAQQPAVAHAGVLDDIDMEILNDTYIPSPLPISSRVHTPHENSTNIPMGDSSTSTAGGFHAYTVDESGVIDLTDSRAPSIGASALEAGPQRVVEVVDLTTDSD